MFSFLSLSLLPLGAFGSGDLRTNDGLATFITNLAKHSSKLLQGASSPTVPEFLYAKEWVTTNKAHLTQLISAANNFSPGVLGDDLMAVVLAATSPTDADEAYAVATEFAKLLETGIAPDDESKGEGEHASEGGGSTSKEEESTPPLTAHQKPTGNSQSQSSSRESVQQINQQPMNTKKLPVQQINQGSVNTKKLPVQQINQESMNTQKPTGPVRKKTNAKG